MYDDYDLDYAFSNEYTYDLDEYSYEYLDESAWAQTTYLDENDEYAEIRKITRNLRTNYTGYN